MVKLKLPHHTEDGYCNLFPSAGDEETPRLPELAAEDPDAGEPLPGVVRPDGDFLRRNREHPTLTWMGHSTFLLQIGGINILTDPHLGQRASALPYIGPRRLVPPAMQAYQLPRIDAVVLSHDHADHLDRRTVNRLIKQSGGPPRFFLPLGVKARLGDAAYALCTELDWWQWAQLSGVVMHCVPAHHESGRLPWRQDETLWCGWVIEYAGARFYFAGDTGYSPALLEIGRHFPGIELAALPIAGHASRWRQRGMNLTASQAVRLHQELGPRRSVAMHWGTFAIGDQPSDLPPRRLAHAAALAGLDPGEFFTLRIGEVLPLENFPVRDWAGAPPDSAPPSGNFPPRPAWRTAY